MSFKQVGFQILTNFNMILVLKDRFYDWNFSSNCTHELWAWNPWKFSKIIKLVWFKNWNFKLFRSSHQMRSVKVGVLKNFPKFTGKHACWSLQHSCFPVKFAKLLRTSISKNICKRLLLVFIGRVRSSSDYQQSKYYKSLRTLV